MITTLIVSALLAAEVRLEDTVLPSPERSMGGVASPAVLPAGAAAAYLLMGAPDVAVGYRQGVRFFEVEGRAGIDYFDASFSADAIGRFTLHKSAFAHFAGYGGVGIVANTGARYYSKANFGYFGLRPRLGFLSSLQFTETIAGLFQVDVPWTLSVTSAGSRWVPTAGAGAEMHLGGQWTGLVMGNIGLDAIKEPLGVTQFRPAWQIRVGLGYRLF
ncbi:MAG: hypothetical protein K1X64_04650 [Myxococcaceae bacterium]|nr:hypothetical protein [Myxococcaceae bacterium]